MSESPGNSDADLRQNLLRLHLQTVVPLRIIELQEKGGPDDDDLRRVSSYGKEIAEHGDLLLFRSRVPGQTAAMVNKLVEALATLAFLPGGVRLFGLHFEANPSEPPTSD